VMTVSQALQQRISVRSFLPTPVPRDLVHDILNIARYAPSGGNLQPWKVMVFGGSAARALKDLALATVGHDVQRSEEGERPMYPAKLGEPYRTRRQKIAEDLYAKLGIPREDKEKRLAHVRQNFAAFGAPTILMFVIDRSMGWGQWAHLGMFMQSVALAAEERGLGTCMQESWMLIRETFHRHFQLPPDDILYCGMALGHPDWSAPVNSLRSDRATVEEIASFHGFDERSA